MELFMRNIDWNVTKNELTTQLTSLLHGEAFVHLSPTPMNFHVRLHPDKRRQLHNHGGTGALTLPSDAIGNLFLELFGTDRPNNPITIGRKIIIFSISKKPKGVSGVVNSITLQPYVEPHVIEQRERRSTQLNEGRVTIKVLQFGWECRDYVFSIESEESCDGQATLLFGDERRELRIVLSRPDDERYYVVINYSHINNIFLDNYLGEEAVIIFSLNVPPVYESEFLGESQRQRLSFLPIPDHQRIAPYASLAIRLVCRSVNDLRAFRDLSSAAHLHKVHDYEYPVERRDLFSTASLQLLETYLRKFNWCVAFQIEGILRNLVVDAKEMLEIMPTIIHIYRLKGKEFTAAMLGKFRTSVKQLWMDEGEDHSEATTVLQCLLESDKEVSKRFSLETLKPTEGSLCDAYHVIITPTTMYLEGPFPERSNRVIRAYEAIHQECFLRVSFADEGRDRYRFDREVDGRGFIHSRVGPFLLKGLTIGSRRFQFLAYSQSALKEHAVWFVKPFKDSVRGLVTADSIIKSLGTFEGLQSDPNLIYYPARYAARISQAFTATDSVQIEVEEIIMINDISTADGKYEFTDGVGTLSSVLAQEIWAQLKKTKRRGRTHKNPPSAYQIRFMGAKGMLSVDHKLQGYAICLRPSMTKFEAAEWTNIEVARAFDRPGVYYLNRPLIMLLEGLGVPFSVFEDYQNRAVRETRQAAQSLVDASSLLEKHGLGTSYRLPSIMNNLAKLGIHTLPDNKFYEKMIEYSVNHVLRLLKNHARIPVPGAWTLVGVADVHRYLQPNEIFVCVKPLNGRSIYLEGPVLISRSPTIHPGDVMIVNAIGRPPVGCCFAAEPLQNTVVFSVLGDRPVPSCLGGGDLDGDVYNLIPLNDLPEFRPARLHPPADYTPAPKFRLDHPSTMSDVANFFMEYINSDVVGIIAINWLINADYSVLGIFDPDCMTLASLHSDAVDYPKSGQPVAIDNIPKLKCRSKPDWNAPETVSVDNGKFYTSKRAIGRLFRAIDLPIEQIRPGPPYPRHRRTRRGHRQDRVDVLANELNNFNFSDARDNTIFSAIEIHVNDFIDINVQWPQDEIDFISQLYTRYVSELRGHCASNTLSQARHAQLEEEEAIVGTIIQKTSQPRKRKDMMAKLREGTDHLVRAIREELEGDVEKSEGGLDISNHRYLERGWMAWELSILGSRSKEFGAQSFGWIALGAIFEAIGKIEESVR